MEKRECELKWRWQQGFVGRTIGRVWTGMKAEDGDQKEIVVIALSGGVSHELGLAPKTTGRSEHLMHSDLKVVEFCLSSETQLTLSLHCNIIGFRMIIGVLSLWPQAFVIQYIWCGPPPSFSFLHAVTLSSHNLSHSSGQLWTCLISVKAKKIKRGLGLC